MSLGVRAFIDPCAQPVWGETGERGVLGVAEQSLPPGASACGFLARDDFVCGENELVASAQELCITPRVDVDDLTAA